MSTRSKLSCLSWNKFTKNHIASSDYEGIVTVWDVTTRQVIRQLPLLALALTYEFNWSHMSVLDLYLIFCYMCRLLFPECNGIWRAWQTGMECWFFTHRTLNACVWQWWLQGKKGIFLFFLELFWSAISIVNQVLPVFFNCFTIYANHAVLCVIDRSKYGAQTRKLVLLTLTWKQIFVVSSIIQDLALMLRYSPIQLIIITVIIRCIFLEVLLIMLWAF